MGFCLHLLKTAIAYLLCAGAVVCFLVLTSIYEAFLDNVCEYLQYKRRPRITGNDDAENTTVYATATDGFLKNEESTGYSNSSAQAAPDPIVQASKTLTTKAELTIPLPPFPCFNDRMLTYQAPTALELSPAW